MCEPVGIGWKIAAYAPDTVVNVVRGAQKAVRALDTTLLVLVVGVILTYRGAAWTAEKTATLVRAVARWHRRRQAARTQAPRRAITAVPHTPPARLQIAAQPHQPTLLVGVARYPVRVKEVAR